MKKFNECYTVYFFELRLRNSWGRVRKENEQCQCLKEFYTSARIQMVCRPVHGLDIRGFEGICDLLRMSRISNF